MFRSIIFYASLLFCSTVLSEEIDFPEGEFFCYIHNPDFYHLYIDIENYHRFTLQSFKHSEDCSCDENEEGDLVSGKLHCIAQPSINNDGYDLFVNNAHERIHLFLISNPQHDINCSCQSKIK